MFELGWREMEREREDGLKYLHAGRLKAKFKRVSLIYLLFIEQSTNPHLVT